MYICMYICIYVCIYIYISRNRLDRHTSVTGLNVELPLKTQSEDDVLQLKAHGLQTLEISIVLGR